MFLESACECEHYCFFEPSPLYSSANLEAGLMLSLALKLRVGTGRATTSGARVVTRTRSLVEGFNIVGFLGGSV